MSGGSKEPEGPHDKKCPSCGLYYQDKGVSFTMHESACSGESEASESASASGQQSPEPELDGGESSSGDDPTMGSGEVPESAQSGTVLPCGCYSIKESKYDPGIYACDDCGQRFKIE